MKISVNRKNLLDALRFGGMVAGKNKTIPILDYCKVAVKGGKMVVTSTDTEVTIAKKIDGVECDVEVAEFCVVPSDITTILGTLKDENVTLEIEKETCILSHSRGIAKMSTLPAIDFPSAGSNENKISFSMDATHLKTWLDSAKSFVADDPLRPALTGLYLSFNNGEVWCCASNAQKLYMNAYKDSAFEGMQSSFILPQRMLGYASSVLDGYASVTIQADDKNIAFVVSDAKISSRLVVGNYPKVRDLLPKEFPIFLEVNTADFAGSISRMKLFADKNTPSVTMAFSSEGVKLTSSDLLSNKSCEDFCEVLAYDGGSIEISTKVDNIEAIISKIDTETFAIGMSTPKSPIVFYEADNKDKILFTTPLVKR